MLSVTFFFFFFLIFHYDVGTPQHPFFPISIHLICAAVKKESILLFTVNLAQRHAITSSALSVNFWCNIFSLHYFMLAYFIWVLDEPGQVSSLFSDQDPLLLRCDPRTMQAVNIDGVTSLSRRSM